MNRGRITVEHPVFDASTKPAGWRTDATWDTGRVVGIYGQASAEVAARNLVETMCWDGRVLGWPDPEVVLL